MKVKINNDDNSFNTISSNISDLNLRIYERIKKGDERHRGLALNFEEFALVARSVSNEIAEIINFVNCDFQIDKEFLNNKEYANHLKERSVLEIGRICLSKGFVEISEINGWTNLCTPYNEFRSTLPVLKLKN